MFWREDMGKLIRFRLVGWVSCRGEISWGGAFSNWKIRSSEARQITHREVLLRSGEHRMGQQTRSPVRHCEDGSSTLHTQERPQEAPPAETHSQNQSRKRFRSIQQRSDTVAGSLDGCPPDVQRASQQIPEEGQGRRSPTLRTHEDARNHPRAGKSCPNSLRPSCRTIWKRALVGSERDRQTRGSSTPF